MSAHHTPSRSLVICSTQRSGSTYLCSLLARTGVAGNPQEYFEAMAETGIPPHPGFFMAGLARTGVGIRDDIRPSDAPEYSDLRTVHDWRAHLDRTYALGTTPNGVFSTKLMWNQLPEVERLASSLPELTGLSGPRLLRGLFGQPRFVWLRRRDKVQQAISLWRALQTRAWQSEHTRSEDASSYLKYSFDGIEHLRRRLTADEIAWGNFFLEAGVEPLELSYEEDVQPSPADAVSRVLALVDVRIPLAWTSQTSLVRQTDDVNRAWRASYDRDLALRADS